MHLELRPEGQELPGHMRALRFETPQLGHLRIEIADQHGKSTPALVQLAAQENGHLYEIPGAVDLREQLNDIVPHIAELGRGYTFHLPGKKKGRYWVVEEPLELSLPAGKWNLTVLHGPEHSPYRQELEVVANEWTHHECRLQRWIDMPKQGWYSGDDHVHARLMNGADAKKLLAYSRAVDIHVANILEMGDPMRTYYAQRGHGRQFRVNHGDRWLIPGQEDPRSELGHVIGLNLERKVRDLDRYLLNDWLAEEIHRQGGLYGHTHMGANACFVHRQMAIFTPMEIVDFNSIMQADLGTELYYDMLNLGYKMTASAGADTPYGGTIGAVRIYAYVGVDDQFSPDTWFESLRKGRTFVTNGPMIEFRVENSLPGDELLVQEDRPLKVYAKASGLAGVSAPKRLRLVHLGESYRELVSEDPEQEVLELEATVPSGFGGWLAVLAEGHDGSEAHTTPVYVKRDGFRHWNLDLVPRLIEKQIAALDETDAALAKSEELVKSQHNPLDYWNRVNAQQAEEVRKRLQIARRAYNDLGRVAEDEHVRRRSVASLP